MPEASPPPEAPRRPARPQLRKSRGTPSRARQSRSRGAARNRSGGCCGPSGSSPPRSLRHRQRGGRGRAGSANARVPRAHARVPSAHARVPRAHARVPGLETSRIQTALRACAGVLAANRRASQRKAASFLPTTKLARHPRRLFLLRPPSHAPPSVCTYATHVRRHAHTHAHTHARMRP
eukprot:354071-Chlamydomonas_euryale.AAC.1